MKTLLKFGTLGTLSLVAILSAARSAEAQNSCSPYLGYWPYPGYGDNAANYEYVPYFALHPPVYYSLPVPRTYGYSPFAYPPGTMTPELAPPTPVEIINPYVPQTPKKDKPASSKSASTKTVAARPQVVVNPYVTPEAKVSTRDAGE